MKSNNTKKIDLKTVTFILAVVAGLAAFLGNIDTINMNDQLKLSNHQDKRSRHF